jgi:hypothetical protein
LKDEELI